MQTTIHCACTKAEIRRWIRYPEILYRDWPQWSPPLWADEDYSSSNPILAKTDFVLHYAMRDGKMVGRNLVYVSHHFNQHYQARTGMFGAFECVDDPEVSRALFEAGFAWLRERGMDRVRGPIHPVAELWGMLLEGFDTPGVFLSPWNPPYYDKLCADSGLERIQDLYAYTVDSATFSLQKRYSDFYGHFFQRHPGYTVRGIYKDKRLDDDARAIMDVGNLALAGNWGYLPTDYATLRDMLDRLRPIIDPDAIKFIEYQGEVVAFCVGYPDLNEVLRKTRGRLFPTGWFHILRAVKTIKNYRLFALIVHPAHQGKGLDAILYVELAKALCPRKIKLEANWILEENIRMNNGLNRLQMEKGKVYRVYERAL